MSFLDALEHAMDAAPIGSLRAPLQASLSVHFDNRRHGDAEEWQSALSALPALQISEVDLNSDCIRIGNAADAIDAQRRQLYDALQRLHPWRKGPFDLCGLVIDSEWRSDMKWNRLRDHIAPLRGRLVLDVGCGNGYYALRMAGAGARCVVGIDPTLRFLAQFEALRTYLGRVPVLLLPLRSEDLPPGLGTFDTVFSMGVLYHRRSPLDHLAELHGALRSGGELVLETLVIDGDAKTAMIPPERYAKMRNVWFLPSCESLLVWLHRAGFDEARVVDVTRTTGDEQRRTEWMRFESLSDFLDPVDPCRTTEGHPAPVRAMLLARKA
jgi:tRNA (mo5U34)-methyltransferase